MTVTVSDHALLRYLERVLGLDVEFFRQQCADLCAAAVAAKATCACIEGHWYILRDRGVVTVLARKHRPKRKDRIGAWRPPALDDEADDFRIELTSRHHHLIKEDAE